MQNNKWKGVDGIERNIKDMSPMHLAMVCKQLENGNRTFDEFKARDFGARLINSSLTLTEWRDAIKKIRAGEYHFYPDSKKLDTYYMKLVNNYKAFLAPKCLQFKEHYNELLGTIDDAIEAYRTDGDIASVNELRIAKTKSCSDNWFDGRYELIRAAATLSSVTVEESSSLEIP